MMSTIKTTTLILALLLMGMITGAAQSSENISTEFGIKGGVNRAKLKNVDGKARIGLVAGAFVELGVSDGFSIRPEALYSVQGVKVGSEKTKLNYINVPVLAKFYPVEKFSIEAGPQLGYLLSKKGGSLDKSDYRKLDWGAAFGAGYHITENLEIGTRYNLGLRDITKTAGKIKNSVFQITLSYGF